MTPNILPYSFTSGLLVLLWTTLTADTADVCLTDVDCDTASGRRCVRLYDGCYGGQCMCRSRSQHSAHDNAADQCVNLRAGYESCTADVDTCRPGMTCREGQCQCVSGRMTSDHLYCLSDNEKLLNDNCLRHRDVCLHLGVDGYKRSDVSCQGGRCVCQRGFKSDGVRCKHWNIDEYGCVESHHCSGGAICHQQQCICPTGYRTTASGTKCAKRGAVVDAEHGSSCDEINERRYCGHGLICHACPGDNRYQCVRFLLAEEYAYLLNSARSFMTSHQLITTVLISPVYIYTMQFVLR